MRTFNPYFYVCCGHFISTCEVKDHRNHNINYKLVACLSLKCNAIFRGSQSSRWQFSRDPCSINCNIYFSSMVDFFLYFNLRSITLLLLLRVLSERYTNNRKGLYRNIYPILRKPDRQLTLNHNQETIVAHRKKTKKNKVNDLNLQAWTYKQH